MIAEGRISPCRLQETWTALAHQQLPGYSLSPSPLSPSPSPSPPSPPLAHRGNMPHSKCGSTGIVKTNSRFARLLGILPKPLLMSYPALAVGQVDIIRAQGRALRAIVEDAGAILGKETGGATSVAERSRDQTERGGGKVWERPRGARTAESAHGWHRGAPPPLISGAAGDVLEIFPCEKRNVPRHGFARCRCLSEPP